MQTSNLKTSAFLSTARTIRRRFVNTQRQLLSPAKFSASLWDDEIRQHGSHTTTSTTATAETVDDDSATAKDVATTTTKRRSGVVCRWRRGRHFVDGKTRDGQHHPHEHGQTERTSGQRFPAEKVSELEPEWKWHHNADVDEFVEIFSLQVLLSAGLTRVVRGGSDVINPERSRLDDGRLGKQRPTSGDRSQTLAKQGREDRSDAEKLCFLAFSKFLNSNYESFLHSFYV